MEARADTLAAITSTVVSLGLRVEAWYGVRMLTDALPADEPVDEAELPALLRAEGLACSRDPYRRLASQIHVLARRTT